MTIVDVYRCCRYQQWQQMNQERWLTAVSIENVQSKLMLMLMLTYTQVQLF